MAYLITLLPHPTTPTPYRGSGNRGKLPTVPFLPIMGIVGKSNYLTIGVVLIC